ncbi:MAG TPA: nicotinate-nucleotide adenylyltransferase [Terriglobales bacterium]|nr:nicotinate-nucleotide adenylyltransferase [Terriglobales bacterium]
MNVAIFGGTFDPIHRGHLAVASAARRQFRLERILFVPSGRPPHKRRQPLASFEHRYAMVTLATAGHAGFVPSLMEAPAGEGGRRPSYSIDTLRRIRPTLKRGDRLVLIIGIDAFLEIATWHEAENVLHEAEFIVANRPGFSLDDVAAALPPGIRPSAAAWATRRSRPQNRIVLGDVKIHLLTGVHRDISATQIRSAVRSGRNLDRLVPSAVADYIRKMNLYRSPPD